MFVAKTFRPLSNFITLPRKCYLSTALHGAADHIFLHYARTQHLCERLL